MKKMIIAIFLTLSTLTQAQAKNLISQTPGCPNESDLEIYEFPDFTKGVRIHSAEAEWEIIFKATVCGIYPGDQGYCKYKEIESGSFQEGQEPLSAALYSSGYDLEFSGSFYLNLLDGRECRYVISEE
jgi:hypothetical protein